MERTAFLDRLRRAVGGVDGPALPATFPATPASARPDDEPAERFCVEVARSGGLARVVSRAELAGAVEDALREAGLGRNVVVSEDTAPFRAEIEEGLASAGAEVTRPGRSDWTQEAARSDWGITSARLGVAATGSVLLVPGPDAPRAASLLPPAHLVVMPADSLVSGLEEAMPVLASVARSSSAPTLVSGPSRTSDIEMTMVIGVHGPRVFRVLLVR
jgi:L-lactate dehydrogenase complex protein LldG